jgi:hypothetical protein
MGVLSSSANGVSASSEVSARIESEPYIGTDILMKGEEADVETPSRENEPHVTPEMERRLLRKLDRRIIPLIMALCM